MAVVVAPDWHFTKQHPTQPVPPASSMDPIESGATKSLQHQTRSTTPNASTTRPSNEGTSRSSSTEPSSNSGSTGNGFGQSPHQYVHQQSYPAMAAGWTPPATTSFQQQVQPFGYPGASFGYFPQQSPQAGFVPGQIPPQFASAFDPSQQHQQYAQWAAYQQMLFNQQQQMVAASGMTPNGGGMQRQRNGSSPGSPPEQGSFMTPHGMMMNGFQVPVVAPNFSHSHSHPSSHQSRPSVSSETSPAFHPYRRQVRSQSTSSAPSSVNPNAMNKVNMPPSGFPPFQPPYTRERNGSANSVGSSQGSGSGRSNGSRTAPTDIVAGDNRQRSMSYNAPSSTTANAAVEKRSVASQAPQQSSGAVPRSSSPVPAPPTLPRPRTSSATSRSSASSGGSSSRGRASGNATPNTTSPSLPAASTQMQNQGSVRSRPPPRPSPLSQPSTMADSRPSSSAGTPNANKRLSKDDSDLKDYVLNAQGQATAKQANHGLKGRFRRALAFNAVDEEREGAQSKPAAASAKAEPVPASSKGKEVPRTSLSNAEPPTSPGLPSDDAISDMPDPSVRSTKKKSRAGSLFNRKWNASTDNISLSSTVSSASLMIRKIGSVGALARRKSLSGITSLFKKDKDKESQDKNKSDPTSNVTLATAEVERSTEFSAGSSDPDMAGLSPAAKLARQHTLRSNAEAAAREREATAARDHSRALDSQSGGTGMPTWDRDTASRRRGGDINYGGPSGVNGFDENDEDEYGVDYDEEDDGDVTIRHGSLDGEVEPWAVGIRRSIERTRVPTKGILKNATNYKQEDNLELVGPNSVARIRANSYDNLSPKMREPGPLAHLPTADPDHIDGLQTDNVKPDEDTGLLPPLNFTDLSDFADTPLSSVSGSNERSSRPSSVSSANKPYQHPNMNSSAPTLSLAPALLEPSKRSHTAPVQRKQISFAAHLSVYDTFPPNAYDRRSEPATCNHLTPALAQRIKEELNSFKMEEMEVHQSSRAHTQFFA